MQVLVALLPINGRLGLEAAWIHVGASDNRLVEQLTVVEVPEGGGGVAVVVAGGRVGGRDGGRGRGVGYGGKGPDGHVALLPPVVGPQPGGLLLQPPDPKHLHVS